LKTTTHHADSGEDESAETDDGACVDGERFERSHERLCSGEVHRPLGVSRAGDGEGEEGEYERAKQAGRSSVEGAFGLGIRHQQAGWFSESKRQPNGGSIRSESRGTISQFAPPLIACISMAQT
jgi:hypothetical protein